MADPQKDEHIDELLSKLQGIFGKLSHSEEEESKEKIEVPQPAPKEPEKKEEPIQAPRPAPLPIEKAPVEPIRETVEEPKAQTASPPPMASFNLFATEPTAPPKEVAPADGGTVPITPPSAPPIPATPSAYESTVPISDPEKVIVPTALFFPPGKMTEGKSLAQKLETMTPKFTKVAFRLRVSAFAAYEPKTEWKDFIVQKAKEAQCQTVFVVVERPLDDAKRKAISSELESNKLYYQEVPLASIEKKAFYTDILLGLVFFFDSHRPAAGQEGNAA